MKSQFAVGIMSAIALITVGIDQGTKLLIVNEFYPGEVREIIPGLMNLILTYNPGAAFGLFANLDQPLRGMVLLGTGVIAFLILFLLLKEYRESLIGQMAIALVFGGAVGNLIDRIRLGEVVDFLDFYIGQYHWPAFNVADSAICVGVVVLLLLSLKGVGQTAPPSAERE